MSWIVNFQVVSGTFDSRPNDDRNQIWVGETVRFTLSLDGDPDPAQTRDAQNPRNWLQAPQLVVTGADSSGRPISIPVRHDPTNPLLFNYLFRFEGRKQLSFTGIPREVALPAREATPPTMRRSVAPTSILFPPIQYEMQLQVLTPPRTGRDVASMQGIASQTARQGRREYEDLSTRYQRVEAERVREIADDRRQRRRIAEQRRLERGVRDGILDFRIKTEAEIREIHRTSELEEYLLNLQAAIAATTPLDLRRRPDERHPEHPGVLISYYWESARLQNGDIAFFQVPTARSSRPAGSRGREIVYIYDSERERVRRETQVVFPANTWIVAIRPGERRKLLFLASELGSDISWENFWGSFNAASFVLGLALAPASTIGAYLGDLLLDTLLPPQATSAVRTAQLFADLINGLRFALSLAFRRPTGRLPRGTSRLMGATSDAVDSGRRASTPSRSTTISGSRATQALDESDDIARGSRSTEATTQPDSEARGTTSASRGTLSVPDTDDFDIILDRSFEATFGGQLVDMNAAPYRPPSAPFSVSARARQIFRAARERFRSLQPGYARQLGVGRGGQVHHAIELQVIQRYGSVFTERELNSFANMRGIPPERTASGVMDAVRGRRQLHNSYIRQQWDRQYAILDQRIRELGLRRGSPEYRQFVRQSLEEGRREIDNSVGQFFSEVRMGETWTRGMLPEDMASLPDADGVVRRGISQ